MIIIIFYLSKLATNTIMISFSSNQKVNFSFPIFCASQHKNMIYFG